MSSIPTSFNPSDYEFLLKSISEGNMINKAECLKRFNALVLTDKKQFIIYAKRVVLSIQDLLTEPKEDINLLSCTLALQIINLNPREIQYYIRTKLLKNLVRNLGDSKPQIRKTSHYCLLAYVKMYKTFDEIIQVYITMGISCQEWQLRQKSINSFQSILIMEMKYMNWGSAEFKKIFQILLAKLTDENPYVQKAAEQCLLSLSKIEEIRQFSKKLSKVTFGVYKAFCQAQKEMGNLIQIKLDLQPKGKVINNNNNSNQAHHNVGGDSHKNQIFNIQENKNYEISNNSLNNSNIINKQAIVNRVEQIRKNSQNPIKQINSIEQQSKKLKKAESVIVVHNKLNGNNMPPLKEVELKQRQISMNQIFKKQRNNGKESMLSQYNNNTPINKSDKNESILGKKILQDLRNQKDWKIRLQAVEQLQIKFNSNKIFFDNDYIIKTLIPILMKLLSDSNFKVALICLRIMQEILQMRNIQIEHLIPQLVDKLSDNKIALRQNISKLIKKQYDRTQQSIWIDSLLAQLRKNSNANIKEEVLNILLRLYEEKKMNKYSIQRIVQAVAPLMQDLKTKIKIKTLDLLVMITIKTQKLDLLKNLLSSKLNQIYYEMYLEKVNKQCKNNETSQINKLDIDKNSSFDRTVSNRTLVKRNRNGNLTSSLLQRNSRHQEHISTVRTQSFTGIGNCNGSPEIVQKQGIKIKKYLDDVIYPVNAELINKDNNLDQTTKKKPDLLKKNYKGLEHKNSSNVGLQSQSLLPFTDPQKELKNIMTQLKSQDWQIGYEASTKLRRISQHHNQLLITSITKPLIQELMKLVESLRSSVSKNAVITLNDLSNQIKSQLDSELDLIFTKLIKKTLDANSFISQQVKKALISVCSNGNSSKVMNLLISSHTSRALPIKQVIIEILEKITFIPKYYDRQLERIVLILGDFMGQGSLQIRQKTKILLNNIVASEKGPSIMRLIPSEHLHKLQKLRGNKSKEHFGKSGEEEESSPKIQRLKKIKIIAFPVQFQELDTLLEKCQSSDWKVRSQGMTMIANICSCYPEEILQHKLSSRIIDVLSKQIGDPNIKVATNALKIFSKLADKIPNLIEINLSIIMNELFNCFASQKDDIKVLAEGLFNQIQSNIQHWMLLQHMCNGCLYGIPKSRIIILQKLINIVVQVYHNKPKIFQKIIYPMLNKLAEQKKVDIIPLLKKMLNILYDQIGQPFLNSIRPKTKQLLFQ